eukprot:TRINITY_DN9161_c0_g2_i1.p1 TRINITY_DN9161_c0_g2~~TRINITY_DN9161_c0_g2_i1.p1  ORF type:complete len:112 (+),score=33.94 TRINITY_DN9161_c0_g2_i1:80-415(+)
MCIRDRYEAYADKEKMERTLNNRKVLLRSLFMKLGSEDSDTSAQCSAFIDSLDNELGLQPKISTIIDTAAVSAACFDDFWRRFVDAMKEQKALTYSRLEEALESKYPSYKK